MKPEAFIEVRFKTTAEGGRKGPVFGQHYGCPLLVDGEYFDCRLLLDGQQFELGQTYQAPVVFLHPELVLPKLSVGKSVTLWEGKDVGTGKVIQLARS